VAFEKNIDFLLRVVRELKRSHPDILLIIAGEGPAERHLRRLSQRLGLTDNVLFVGYLSRQGALADCYRAGDAFVFASRTETQGLVLLEAMSLGVPVVSTAIMGTRDILLGGQGALVAEENAVDFASKVRRLLDDADLRQRLGEQGREYAHQWTAEGPAQALLAFYEEMITGRATLSMSLSS
jgi:glycosyltransferase involved in cell wall biosynthesis